MQTMEIRSTDKRIDDLNSRVSEGFQRVDQQMAESFQRVDQQMAESFQRVDGDIRELRGDIRDLRRETSERFDAMHRTMMRGFFALGGITVTLFLALAGLQGF
jgi:hypothetical protein